mmetsp:Transcript_21206/g.52824  ORF Transcript_21206/g.52824 Transcript_21206/m.52824 type:complete len:161 (-) Transcript_21206:540-1022(-)
MMLTLARTSARPLRALAAPTPRLYHKNIVDHYESPKNVGSMDKSDPEVGTGLVGAPACGDVMKLQMRVGPDGRVEKAVFKTFGCGSAIASSSYATEWLKGKTLEECETLQNKDIAAHLKLPPVKLHCSMLAEDAVKMAVKDYQSKRKALEAQEGEKAATA